MEKRLFTSESVTEGHPDKICDAISDAILDALLAQDPMSRVACETCTTTGYVMVMGEITSKAQIDIQQIVRDTVREIGYDRAKYGFDADTCAVITALDKQSADIAMGVDKALEAKENSMSDEEIDAIGAGDQGMMFGFATNETEEYMPYAISMAHKLARQLTKVRKDGTLSYLRPDGKTQVTVEYDENGRPFRLDAVVLSTQHDPEVSQEQIHEDIKKYVFDKIIPAEMVDEHTKFFINPTGRFVIGGPHGDSGLTGRKIIVDTYGGYARHGGGAFSGKDCCFSYSEWWRYIDSENRQPPDRIVCTGRCQPERNFRTIRGFEHYYSGPLKIADLFCSEKMFRNLGVVARRKFEKQKRIFLLRFRKKISKEKRRKRNENGKTVYF